MLDTGAGLSVISSALADKAGCVGLGSPVTVHRMSGQPLSIELGRAGPVELGTHRCDDVPVGIFDLAGLAGFAEVDGLLSLSHFRSVPMTIDYGAGVLAIEDDESAVRRADLGFAVDVHVDYDGCVTELMLDLNLPSGRTITVEVDTGSELVTLNEPLAADADVDLAGGSVRTYEGTDETGYEFTRHFATVAGDISIAGAPQLRVTGAEAMFQKIIYDGLVGDRFLRNFTTTYDLPNSRMIFALPGLASPSPERW